jgi:mono/diheme cytochrome c family protein
MKKFLKWFGIAAGGLLVLLIIAAAGLAVYANANFKPKLADRPLYPITADASPQGLARGKYLVENVMDCTNACHTPEDGPALSGHVENINEGPMQAVFAVPNLTPDQETGLGSWSDAEIARAIREGVDKDGVGLVIMPAYTFHGISDKDVAAIVGYLRSLQPVKHPIPPFQANLVAKSFKALGMFGANSVQEPIQQAVIAPDPGTPEYGLYLIKLGGCMDCHGSSLAGGPMTFASAGDPPAANLTPGGELVGWSVQDFITAVRTGVKPSGTKLAEAMPHYGTSDEDLADIFNYLKTLPAAQPKQ